MKDCIRLYRGFLRWEHYGDPSVKELFLHLLLTADGSGRLLTGTDELCAGLSRAGMRGRRRKAVTDALAALERSGEIRRARKGGKTEITIVNYMRFQKDAEEAAENETAGKGNECPPSDGEEEMFASLRGSASWLANVCCARHMALGDVLAKVEEFRMDCLVREKRHADLGDLKNHFINWLSKNGNNRKGNGKTREERMEGYAGIIAGSLSEGHKPDEGTVLPF